MWLKKNSGTRTRAPPTINANALSLWLICALSAACIFKNVPVFMIRICKKCKNKSHKFYIMEGEQKKKSTFSMDTNHLRCVYALSLSLTQTHTHLRCPHSIYSLFCENGITNFFFFPLPQIYARGCIYHTYVCVRVCAGMLSRILRIFAQATNKKQEKCFMRFNNNAHAYVPPFFGGKNRLLRLFFQFTENHLFSIAILN